MDILGMASLIFESEKEIEQFSKKIKELEALQGTLRSSIIREMKETGETSALDGAISLRQSSGKVTILDENAVPETYKRPDKRAILQAISHGCEVAGVKVTYEEYLRINVKKLSLVLDGVHTPH